MKINVIQSANFVPGVSGYRLDLKAGVIEISSGHIAAGSLPSDPQMITVTAGEWPNGDLPASAIERYKFIGDQVMSIPSEHRDSAEFSTEDLSFDRDGSDIRTILTYQRLETEHEAAERASRQLGSGVVISDAGMTITRHGKVVARIARLEESNSSAGQPFLVVGGQVFVDQALIEQSVTKAQIVDEASARAFADETLAGRTGALEAALAEGNLKTQFLVSSDRFAVTMAKNAAGQYVCTGIGVGIEAEQKPMGLDEVLELLATQISQSSLGLELQSKIDAMDSVRDVIRQELKPGGMLYRG